ncbi:MAG: 5-formyltetrahydrofolate cyclo-ligase [Clostridia bacterium]|nr:5-formyltetrahydrofolate cyclo-ligase [Clostridia bacterium]
MRKITDIREYKARLRAQCRAKREALTPDEKQRMDASVLKRATSLYKYKEAKTVVTYVSTAIEVDTRELINHALRNGKRVAVPRCVPDTREMEFFYINSLDELEKGSFSVDEPNPDKHEKVTDFKGSICFVPGLCFDKRGYRLGYGKGYYDRFLSGYEGTTVGLCYSNCIRHSLIYGKFDRKSDIVITERGIIRTYL